MILGRKAEYEEAIALQNRNSIFRSVSLLMNYGIIIVLIILIALFSVVSKNFFTKDNLFNVLRQVSIVGISSVGMTFVLLTGGIDLSVGSIIGVAGVGAAELMLMGVGQVPSCLIMLVVCACLGLINGFFINKFNIPPLITTLGTMTALRGLAYKITGGLPVFGFDRSFARLGQGYIGVVPIPVIFMLITFAIGVLFIEKTRFGRYIYGVGGNEEATHLSGINIKRVKYLVYGISGFLSGLAGLVLLARINSGQPKGGQGYEMDIITAVVLGGISISGGEGKLLFVIVGVLIMGVLSNGMIMMNVDDYTQQIVKGLVLILAVGLDKLSQEQKAKMTV